MGKVLRIRRLLVYRGERLVSGNRRTVLGDDAGNHDRVTGHFPDSQDQRNTVRDRIRYQVIPRLWIAVGSDYNSGLPFQPDLTPQQYATEYGQAVINHLNFNRDRIDPYFTQNASLGADLYQRKNAR